MEFTRRDEIGATVSVCIFRDTVPTGMVVFCDFDTTDYPRAQTGLEEFLFLPGCLVVMGNSDKDIRVEVRVGGSNISGAQRVFEGVMTFHSGVLSISDPESPNVESLHLPRSGSWNVQVYLRSMPEMDEMYFIFDFDQWKGE
ncbi:hypothetical protein GCM10015535_28070 [Streptomyces gelaticus]|uniref:Uncharacterized protein n=1 Tax=Streptomyces gelaticus TaxID=285446 RepID=A0ABQ2W0R8_9ACTN|nr:hypothetical protein GCM10015535_28070 [Streptomyces gelaticus]